MRAGRRSAPPTWPASPNATCSGAPRSTVVSSKPFGKTDWRNTVPDDADEMALTRWRLVLGKFSERGLGACGGLGGKEGREGRYGRMDRALDYLYGREYAGRGVRKAPKKKGEGDDEDEDESRQG